MTSPAPRWGTALVRRENGRGLWLWAAGTILVAAATARTPASGSLLPAVLRIRFDTLVLAAAAVLLVLRIGLRVDADHREGWLLALLAAGAARTRYGIGLAAAAYVASAVIFSSAAVSLAVAVRVHSGSSELIDTLPRLLAGGLLLLAFYAAFTGVVALLLRRAVATVLVVGACVIVPYMLLTRQLLSTGSVTWWAYALTYVAPPILPPADVATGGALLMQLAVACLLLSVISRRIAGRIP